jgi:hypothetical protein
MARSVPIEAESGTYNGHTHQHNGYYAGNFGSAADTGLFGVQVRTSTPGLRDRLELVDVHAGQPPGRRVRAADEARFPAHT